MSQRKFSSRNTARLWRKRRVRAKVHGTAERPRLSVFRSLRALFVQVIDDTKGRTLVSASSKEVWSNGGKKEYTVEHARALGELLAKKCQEKGVTEVVFDRGGYKYHGKVAALAEGVRKGGLKC